MDPDAMDTVQPMSPAQASQLLSAVLGRHATPLDRLLARCAALDGTSWTSEVLRSLDSETESVEGCRGLKDRAKALIAEPSEEGHDPAAFLSYLYSIAVACDTHGVMISTAAPEEVARGLASAALHLDTTWREIFLRAAARIRSQVV